MGGEGRRERGAAGLIGERCPSCGGHFTPNDGATHSYMLSSPGCWAAYGALLAREYEHPQLFGAAHRLTVDAYALQHPGDPLDRRARQSVWVHHAALYLALDLATPFAAIPPLMARLTAIDLPALPPRPAGFAVTVADVLLRPEAEHVAAVRDWAVHSYEAWAALKPTTRALLGVI